MTGTSPQFTKVYIAFVPGEKEEVYVPFQEAMDALQAERERLVSAIEKLDFYQWNENTQRIIKDKIYTLINPPSN